MCFHIDPPRKTEFRLRIHKLCLNCRAGACEKHDYYADGPNKRAIGHCRKHNGGRCTKHNGRHSKKTNADGKYSIKALEVMRKLPAELQIQIASQLDPRTIFSLRHADSPFRPLWDSHGDKIIRELRRRYSAEAAVFPEVAPPHTTTISGGLLFGRNFPLNHYFLFLELIRDATDSIANFLVQYLSIPADYAEELPSVIVLLWRLFGSVPAAPFNFELKKQEVFTYFHSLSKHDRNRILECFQQIGLCYSETLGFGDYAVHGVNVPARFHALFKQTDAFRYCLEFFAMEWIRDGMRKVFSQVSHGRPADPKRAFRPRWDWRKTGYHKRCFSMVHMDPWSYEISFLGTHHDEMLLYPPFARPNVVDMLRAFKFAAEIDGADPLPWKAYRLSAFHHSNDLVVKLPGGEGDEEDEAAQQPVASVPGGATEVAKDDKKHQTGQLDAADGFGDENLDDDVDNSFVADEDSDDGWW